MWRLTQFWLRQYLKQGRIAVVYAVVLAIALLNGFIYSDRFEQEEQQEQELKRHYEETISRIKDYSAILFADAGNFRINMPPSGFKFLADKYTP